MDIIRKLFLCKQACAKREEGDTNKQTKKKRVNIIFGVFAFQHFAYSSTHVCIRALQGNAFVERHKSVDNASTQRVWERKQARSGIFICVLYKNHFQQYECRVEISRHNMHNLHTNTHTYTFLVAGFIFRRAIKSSCSSSSSLYVVLVRPKNMATVFKCVE